MLKTYWSFWKIAGLLLCTYSAHAVESMPWECPLCGLAEALRGPTALAVGTIAFFIGGAGLIWGEELTNFGKKSVTLFIGISFMIGCMAIVSWIARKMGVGTAVCIM